MDAKLSDQTLRTIRIKARQLVGKAGFTSEDVEDAEQDLALAVLEGMQGFDPGRGSEVTFVANLIERKVCKLVRDRLRDKRDVAREACSLNAYIEDGDGSMAERMSTVDEDAIAIRVGKRNRTREEETRLRLEVADALPRLSEGMRHVAECLMASENMTEAAQRLGVSRSTLYGLLEELRPAFSRAGFREDF